MPLLPFSRFVLITEDYKTAKQAFLSQNGESAEIDDAIQLFRKYQNNFKGDQKNIDWWTKQGWEKFQNFITNYQNVKDDQKYKDQVTLIDNDIWLIVVPTNHQASCFHGKNTDWCTAKYTQPMFSRYFFTEKNVLIYCIRKSDKQMWAIRAAQKLNKILEIRTQTNKKMNPAEFETETGMNVSDVLQWALVKSSEIDNKRKQTQPKDFYQIISGLNGKRNADVEAQIFMRKDSIAAAMYAYDVISDRWKEAEPLIAKNPAAALKYSNIVGRFPDGEPEISKDPKTSYKYALIIHGRFPAGEPAIAKSAEYSYSYASYVLQKPFPAGEPAIAKSAEYSYSYAKMLEKPFPAGEAAIAKDDQYSYSYASYVLQKPFPAGEASIAKDAEYSYLYAKYILQKPFPAGEAAISKNEFFSKKYKELFK